MSKPSAKDRIVDAYEQVLLESGPATVTLEGVASQAGVSKGGLLYHFASKEALAYGLLDRLRALTYDDIEKAKASDEGIVRYYLRTSATDVMINEPLHRATLAAIKLTLNEPQFTETVEASMTPWRELIAEHAPDELSGELIAILGEGIYLRATLGEGRHALLVDKLDQIIERLTGT